MAVTNNIREIREQRGIYQDDLAAAIGYSTKTVGRIERGDSTPSAEFMLRISKYFNMLADLLYVGKSTNRKLALFGIKTIGDLARADEDVLNSHLGKMGSILWSFANGYDDSPVKLENTHAPIITW